jgi:hypothetical protein
MRPAIVVNCRNEKSVLISQPIWRFEWRATDQTRHFATDRYLSRAERSMPPFFSGSPALPPESR